MTRQTITFVLDTERDRDILRWLEGQANKSAAIREAIRANLTDGDITLAHVYEAIQDLKRSGWVSMSEAQVHTTVASAEPPDIAATLDNLGL
jgi:beta-phosphoglucomutase-like phosphatase (HAD superfamily)